MPTERLNVLKLFLLMMLHVSRNSYVILHNVNSIHILIIMGTATPGSQLFEIVNPAPDFSRLYSGRTALATVVPVPAAFCLFGSGNIGLIGLARPKVPV